MPKTVAYILLAVSGIIWGLREKLHQRPGFFETAFGVSPMSFFGSQQWKRKYIDYDGGDKRAKTKLLSVFPYNDFWHSSWYFVKAVMVGCCLIIGKGLGTWGEVGFYFILVFGITTIAAGLTFRVAGQIEKKKQL